MRKLSYTLNGNDGRAIFDRRDGEPVILDPGEYVCMDVECQNCIDFRKPYKPECKRCNGTGVVPERVG